MYIDDVDINIRGSFMALQIANPVVVGKVERLAKATGLSKTAVVERAVDRLIAETTWTSNKAERMAALLAQLDRIPDRPDAFDPIEWDEHGLPK
jgi:antitoxin VapB